MTHSRIMLAALMIVITCLPAAGATLTKTTFDENEIEFGHLAVDHTGELLVSGYSVRVGGRIIGRRRSMVSVINLTSMQITASEHVPYRNCTGEGFSSENELVICATNVKHDESSPDESDHLLFYNPRDLSLITALHVPGRPEAWLQHPGGKIYLLTNDQGDEATITTIDAKTHLIEDVFSFDSFDSSPFDDFYCAGNTLVFGQKYNDGFVYGFDIDNGSMVGRVDLSDYLTWSFKAKSATEVVVSGGYIHNDRGHGRILELDIRAGKIVKSHRTLDNTPGDWYFCDANDSLIFGLTHDYDATVNRFDLKEGRIDKSLEVLPSYRGSDSLHYRAGDTVAMWIPRGDEHSVEAHSMQLIDLESFTVLEELEINKEYLNWFNDLVYVPYDTKCYFAPVKPDNILYALDY